MTTIQVVEAEPEQEVQADQTTAVQTEPEAMAAME
jgi:hypothetical protein